MNRRMRIAGVVVLLAGAAVVTAGQSPPPPAAGAASRRPSSSRSTTSKSTPSSPTSRAVRPRPQEGRFPGLRGRQAPDDQRVHPRRHPDRAARAAAVRRPSRSSPTSRATSGPFDGRIYILVLDDLHIAVPALTAGRGTCMRKFIERESRRQRSDGGRSRRRQAARTRQEFTSSKRLLLAAVDKFLGQGASGRRRVEAYERYLATVGSPVADASRSDGAEARLRRPRRRSTQLQAIADWFGSVRGRRRRFCSSAKASTTTSKTSSTSRTRR